MYVQRNDAIQFAKRVLRNLDYVEDSKDPALVHPVTQLGISLLGLVVFPWERDFVMKIGAIELSQLEAMGWPKWDINLDDPEKPTKTLKNLIYHVRNATAHGRLTFSSDSPDLSQVYLTIEDQKQHSTDPYWRATISALSLRDFCKRFVKLLDDTIG